MARRSYKRGPRLPLPWEREDSPARVLVSGRRLRPALATVSVLSALAGAYWLGGYKTEIRTTRALLAEVERATREFVVDMGRCPYDTLELVHPPRAGFQYLHAAPTDAWGRPIYLRCRFDTHPAIEVVSAGPSGSLFDADNLY